MKNKPLLPLLLITLLAPYTMHAQIETIGTRVYRDNRTILEACPTPSNVTISNIGHSYSTVNWTGVSDSYIVKYREPASEEAPFKEDFESDTSFANWTFISMNNANAIGSSHGAGRYTEAAYKGLYGFRFSSKDQISTGEHYNQYLISPELNITGVLKLYCKKKYNSSEKLRVGYSTTNNSVGSFTWRSDIPLETVWKPYTFEIPNGVKYIALEYYSNNLHYVYVDDITIGAYEIPAGEWETVETSKTTTKLINLTPSTDYEVVVAPTCDISHESTPVIFTTIEAVPSAQTFTLTQGWNWWAPTVETSIANLKTALGTVGILINSQSAGFVSYENGTINGSLEPGEMYKIKTSATRSFTFTGLKPSRISIAIKHGFNWFGFTGESGHTIAEALGNFQPADGDQIIGQNGIATYTGSTWTGNLETLQTGKGYIYYSTANSTKTLAIE